MGNGLDEDQDQDKKKKEESERLNGRSLSNGDTETDSDRSQTQTSSGTHPATSQTGSEESSSRPAASQTGPGQRDGQPPASQPGSEESSSRPAASQTGSEESTSRPAGSETGPGQRDGQPPTSQPGSGQSTGQVEPRNTVEASFAAERDQKAMDILLAKMAVLHKLDQQDGIEEIRDSLRAQNKGTEPSMEDVQRIVNQRREDRGQSARFKDGVDLDAQAVERDAQRRLDELSKSTAGNTVEAPPPDKVEDQQPGLHSGTSGMQVTGAGQGPAGQNVVASTSVTGTAQAARAQSGGLVQTGPAVQVNQNDVGGSRPGGPATVPSPTLGAGR